MTRRVRHSAPSKHRRHRRGLRTRRRRRRRRNASCNGVAFTKTRYQCRNLMHPREERRWINGTRRSTRSFPLRKEHGSRGSG